MNTPTKYSIYTYQDYAYLYYSGNAALNIHKFSDDESPGNIVAKAEDYSNTNLLDLPQDFQLYGYS